MGFSSEEQFPIHDTFLWGLFIVIFSISVTYTHSLVVTWWELYQQSCTKETVTKECEVCHVIYSLKMSIACKMCTFHFYGFTFVFLFFSSNYVVLFALITKNKSLVGQWVGEGPIMARLIPSDDELQIR